MTRHDRARMILAALAAAALSLAPACGPAPQQGNEADEATVDDVALDDEATVDDAGADDFVLPELDACEQITHPDDVVEDFGEDDPSLPDDGEYLDPLFSGSATCSSTAHVGDYCQGDKVSGGVSGTLYRCNGPGPATVIKSCTYECFVAPAGEDDYCKPPPAPRCDADAHVGDYCGTDKVSYGNRNTLYRCNGPGPATKVRDCATSCVIAPSGQDDFCAAAPSSASAAFNSCPHVSSILRWGLAPKQSDHMRCAGVSASRIMQTIGNAAASAGTHAQDGTIQGHPYSAATDISVSGLTNSQVRALLSRLADQGFAAFFRNPCHDGWPCSEARHIHAIYVGVPMKSMLRAQVADWRSGRNGLASHTTYTFWQATSAQKSFIRTLFDQFN